MFDNLNVLKVYFENPLEEYSVRDIAKLAKISPSTASKIIKQFVDKDILKFREYKNILLSKANNSEIFKDMKKFYNIQKLKESGFIDKLNEEYAYPTIILFGTYSRGEDTPNSDIDIAVFSEESKNFCNYDEFEKKLGKELQIFYVSENSFGKNPELVNNMINGTILQGAVKWISKSALRIM